MTPPPHPPPAAAAAESLMQEFLTQWDATSAIESLKREFLKQWNAPRDATSKILIRLPACTTLEVAKAFGKFLKEFDCICLVRMKVKMYRYTGIGWHSCADFDSRDVFGLHHEMFVVKTRTETDVMDEICSITGLPWKQDEHLYMWDSNGNCV